MDCGNTDRGTAELYCSSKELFISMSGVFFLFQCHSRKLHHQNVCTSEATLVLAWGLFVFQLIFQCYYYFILKTYVNLTKKITITGALGLLLYCLISILLFRHGLKICVCSVLAIWTVWTSVRKCCVKILFYLTVRYNNINVLIINAGIINLLINN